MSKKEIYNDKSGNDVYIGRKRNVRNINGGFGSQIVYTLMSDSLQESWDMSERDWLLCLERGDFFIPVEAAEADVNGNSQEPSKEEDKQDERLS